MGFRTAYEACVSDAQCAAGERCESSFDGLRGCVRIGCEGDGDCAPGQRCERTMRGCNHQALGDYLCTSEADECLTHDDCLDAGLGVWCYPDGNRRACRSHTCD